jgi:hypothetical protein
VVRRGENQLLYLPRSYVFGLSDTFLLLLNNMQDMSYEVKKTKLSLPLWRLRQHNGSGRHKTYLQRNYVNHFVGNAFREDGKSRCTSTCLNQTRESGVAATLVHSFEGGIVTLGLTLFRVFDAKKPRIVVQKVYRKQSSRTFIKGEVILRIQLAIGSNHEESATP